MTTQTTREETPAQPPQLVEMSWDPMTRIVGSLGIYTKIDFKQRKIVEAYSSSHIFRGYTEYQFGLIACAILVAGALHQDKQSWWYGPKPAILGSFILLGLMLVPHFFSRIIVIPGMVRTMNRFQ